MKRQIEPRRVWTSQKDGRTPADPYAPPFEVRVELARSADVYGSPLVWACACSGSPGDGQIWEVVTASAPLEAIEDSALLALVAKLKDCAADDSLRDAGKQWDRMAALCWEVIRQVRTEAAVLRLHGRPWDPVSGCTSAGG